MNKFLTKVAKIFLGLSMAAGVGVAIGAGRKDISPAQATSGASITGYIQATALTDISGNAGGNFLIAGVSGGTTYLLPATSTSASTLSGVASGSATLSNHVFTIDNLTAGGSTGYSIKGTSRFYGYGSSGTNIAVNSSATTNKYVWTITKNDTYGTFRITNAGATSRAIVWRSGSTNKFGAYSTSNINGTEYFDCEIYYEAADKTLSSIALSGSYPTTFTQGDTFSHDGVIVTATYSDESTANVTSSATFSGYNMSTTGNQTVTVSYTEGGVTKTATYSITINAPKTPASVSSSGQTTTFDDGDTFSYGGTLTATYTDSTSAGVTPTSFKIGASGINPTSAGTTITPGSTVLSRNDHDGKTIYVLYTENNSTVYTSYVITVNAVSSVTFTYGVENSSTSTLSKSGVTLTIGTPGTDGDLNTNSNNCYKIYKGKTMVVSASKNIAKVEFTCTTQGTAKYGPGCLTADVGSYAYSGYDGTWTGSSTSITFTASSDQTRPTVIKVTFESTDPLVELDATSSTSVSMMKGDSDTSVKVHVANITSKTWTYTFDEDEDEGLSTSSYINVSAGAAVNDVHTLTITTKAVGSTVLHISVSGTVCATTIPVTVAAKPASMMVTESDHETQITTLELQAGGSTKQVYWIGEDTDQNPYSIAASQVNGEIISGGSYVSISSGAGTVITPVAAGTAVIRYSLKVLSSVYAEITVNVVNDYKTTVNEITFNSNLSDTQGDAVDTSEVFSTRVADTHFGSTEVISDSELLFSYENNRSSGEAINVFSYDFSHGITVDSTHKTQTVYVFTTFDTSYSGSFTITVEQKNDPLTAITITNVTNNELELSRGGEFQLEIGYTPANPTDGKEVVYRVDESDSGVSISVSSAGLISVSESSGLGAALIVVESAHDDTIYDWVDVSVTLESMSYQINETESWSVASSLSVGDRVVIAGAHSSTNYELTGVTSNIGQAASFNSDPTGTFTLTVGEGNAENSFTFSNGTSYLAYTLSASSGSNYLYTISNPSTEDQLNQVSWTVSISDGSATITNVYNTNRKILLNYNNGSPRFCAYTSNPSTTMHLPAIYKLTGGLSSKNVDETLFNGVHNNFGAGKTYAWDEVCSSFNSGNWSSAGTALKGISGFANYKLERAVGDINGNEIEQFIAKYDIIIDKFGTDHDFLGRFGAGGINYGSARVVSMINIIGQNINTVAIIVIISMVSVTAIGGYFFLRKRKENI